MVWIELTLLLTPVSSGKRHILIEDFIEASILNVERSRTCYAAHEVSGHTPEKIALDGIHQQTNPIVSIDNSHQITLILDSPVVVIVPLQRSDLNQRFCCHS